MAGRQPGMAVLHWGTNDGLSAYLLAQEGALDKCGMGVANDELLARRAIWAAGSAKKPGIHGNRGVDAGAGDRGEYGPVFGR